MQRSVRRSSRWFPLGFRVAGVIAGLGIGSSCARLPSQRCAPCKEECPADLTCDRDMGRCVEKLGDTCPDVPGNPPISTATTSSVQTGEGGAAGESPGVDATGNSASSNLTSDTSAGGSSANAVNSGGTGGGTTSSTGEGSGGTGSHACDGGGCDPRVLTTNLGPFCAGAAIEVELEAACACDSEEAQEVRAFQWFFEDPPGLTHTPDGVVSGTLSEGTYRFDVTASTNGGARSASGSVVIEVVERCLVLFQSEEATPGAPYLVASRLDTEQATIVPRIGGEEAIVSSFDVSPDGRTLVQVEDIGAERKLQLFDLLDNQLDQLEDVHVDQYLTHAFSPDSRWLAAVAGPTDDPAGANLELIDLHADPVQVIDESGIVYQGGLTWSTAHHVIYVGPTDYYDYSAVLEIVVDDIGLSPPSEYSSTWNILAYDPFVRFLVGEHGFLTAYTNQRCFVDRDAGVCFEFPPFAALSPGLGWGAFHVAESMDLYPLSEAYTEGAPQASIEDCTMIRAWAEDDSTLLCLVNLKPVVYGVASNGALSETPLQLTGALSWNKRAAFSRTGDWLALTPKEDGLVVLPRAEFDTRTLDDVMLEQVADESWDFFFTSDEGKLIVQRGSELFVARLDAQNLPPTFVPVATDLVSRPECSMEDWFLDPASWCGAARFRGNLVVSPDERQLGFVDAAGRVTSVDLTRDDYPLNQHGKLAPGCGSQCIRFR